MDASQPAPSRHRPRPHVAQAHRRPDPAGRIDVGMTLIGLWFLNGRVRAGMSQAQLARRSGLHQSTISRLERGRLEGLRLHRLAILVAVLEDALAELPVGRG